MKRVCKVVAVLVACSNAGAPEEPLDSDHGALSVTGGYLFTMGAEHAVPTSSTATQYTIVFSNFAASKDSYLTVCDADNNVILALKAPCNKFSNGSNSTMVTSPDIENGVTYSIGIAGAAPENYSEFWNDFYIGGTVGSFTSKSSMTVSGMYTGSASSGGFPGGPGGGGFPGGGNRPW